ncbi:hypothetical protein HYC85_009819 [Camellia sinensis]|uniref:Cystatin domain-containing protein n=1 Tax=Camellia sinensis TaxID=4442 RepID=A0A7J7HH13_CAMSI|nr:hypothetical protein HYC85_009819 [Camellia sinensis]
MDTETDFLTYLSSLPDTSDDYVDDYVDDEYSLLKLFGYDEELMCIPPPAPWTGTHNGDDYDDDRDMTDDERRVYSDQVSKSDGFDVACIPGVNEFHQIHPMDINQNPKNYESYSQLAVDEYNRRFKDVKRELEFVKVLMAMAQPSRGFKFYMTFNAKDLADGGNIKTYQALVLMGLDCELSVLSFRLKPSQDEQEGEGLGSRDKEWFWKDQLCHGGCVGV